MGPKITFVLLLNLAAVFAAFPSYLTRCGKDETDLNACVLKRAQEGFLKVINGDPELGIPSYLPLKYTPKKHLGGGGLKFDIENLQVTNINSSTVTDAKWDLASRKVYLYFKFDNIGWKFGLDLKGKFMDKDVAAVGHGTKTFINGWYSYEMQYEPNTVDGVVYPKVKHAKADYDAETVLYSFENLDEATNRYLNKHQKQFDRILHRQIDDFIHENITPAFEGVFKVTPIDELFV